MDLQRRERILALVADVAESLDGEWILKPFPEDWGRVGAWLHEARSQAILVVGESQSSRKEQDRLDVSTDYPKDRDGNTAHEPRPKITVSASKSGAQIARDVERRLLPEYLPLLEQILRRHAAYDSHEDEVRRIARQVAKLVQVKQDLKSPTVSFYHSPYKIFQHTMSQAQVMGDGEVEITLRLDVATGLKVLNQLIHGRFESPDDLDVEGLLLRDMSGY